MIEITVRRRVPSQNESTFGHWRAYARERDAWYALLRAELSPVVPARIKMRATITSYRQRELDYANLVGGAKAIPDGLVKLGYLFDDAPRWFDCTYRQEKCAKVDERTIITLEPAP